MVWERCMNILEEAFVCVFHPAKYFSQHSRSVSLDLWALFYHTACSPPESPPQQGASLPESIWKRSQAPSASSLPLPKTSLSVLCLFFCPRLSRRPLALLDASTEKRWDRVIRSPPWCFDSKARIGHLVQITANGPNQQVGCWNTDGFTHQTSSTLVRFAALDTEGRWGGKYSPV